jgi:5-carboxymethyl-2-hydroxymuconate isomerase
MPHLVIYYTANLEPKVNMTALCRNMADAMLAVCDEDGKQVFPTGGTRVLAYPAPHFAVADGGAAGRSAGGSGDYGFVYMNLRIGKGRSATTHQIAGQALSAAAQAQFAALLANEHMGLTVQIDEGHEMFDAKHSTLHPLFNKAS